MCHLTQNISSKHLLISMHTMSSGSMTNIFFTKNTDDTSKLFSGTLCLIFNSQHQVHRQWQYLQALSRTSPPPLSMPWHMAAMTFRVMIGLEYTEPIHLSDEEVGSIMWQRLTHMFLLVTTLIIIKSSLELSRQSLALFESTACKGHSII
jgi:hypothetical protein